MQFIYRRIFSILLLTLFAYVAQGQVTASFTETSIAGCPPLVDTFINTTTPVSGTTYVWDMGNGTGPITLINPRTSYLSTGTYTVTLTATNGGNTSRYTKVITVYPLPVVDFAVDDTAMCPGVPATYTSTTVPGVVGPLTYLWSFSDGTTATTSPVTHAITFPGRFNISLNATNADGCSALLTKSAYVHVFTPPVSHISANTTLICKPSGTVVFTGTPTGTAPFTYHWDFGDGSGSSSAANPSHLYSSPGVYTVKLIVTDAKGCEDSISMPDYITVTHLHAAFTAPDTGCVNTPVAFTNTSTAYTSSKWYYGDRDSAITANGNHTYTVRDSYAVKLIVGDGSCFDTVIHGIVVPVNSTHFSISPIHPCPAPVTTTFTAGVPSGSVVSWIFGDSTSGVGHIAAHTYLSDKIDTVTMFATSDLGCKDTVSTIYTIYDIVLSHAITPNNNYNFGGCVPTHDTIAVNVQADIPYSPYVMPYPYGETFVWSFGDGSPNSTDDQPIHTYTAIGVYTITATITTGNGCIVTYHDYARAGVAPVVTFTATPLHECYRNNSIGFTRIILSGIVNTNYWRFGEGNLDGGETDTASTTIAHAEHHFVEPGLFSDTLISYYNGCPDTFIRHDYVLIDSPMANISDEVVCSPPKTTSFLDHTLGATTHEWYFGDGDSSSLKNVIHTYDTTGFITGEYVCYNATSGCRDTEAFTVSLHPPVATFSADDTAICKDGHVLFSPTVGTPAPTYYGWIAAGISGNYADRYFTDTFHVPGIYTIKMVIFDERFCPDTITRLNYIHVADPAVHFSVSPVNACWGRNTTFTDASTDIPGTTFSNYTWAFGDGTTVSTGSPSAIHIYTATGLFATTEIVTDNIGCRDSLKQSLVTVYHPVAAFTASATHVCAYTAIHFTNTSTAGTYMWYFGDGHTSSLTSPTYAYADTGHYTVTLVVRDAHGCLDTAIHTAYIVVLSPSVSFTMDDSVAVCPPLLVHFTSTASSGVRYSWDFGTGGPQPRIPNPDNLYTLPGYDTVTLVVTDSLSGCTDTAVSHVKIFGYPGAFSYDVDSGCVPLSVFFRADLTGVPSSATIIWDFSNGVTRTTGVLDTTTYAYPSAGSFIPKLIIRDAGGCVDTSRGTKPIRVDVVTPGFTAIPDPVCSGDTVHVVDTSHSFWSNITTRNWVYDDTSSTLISPLVVFARSGIDTIVLHVTDGWGCTASAIRIVTVNPSPDAGTITSNVVNGFCIGDQFTVHDTVTGGVWSFSNGNVTISGNTITAIAPGKDTLYYTVTNGCGVAVAIDSFTVLPPLPTLMGRTSICVGDTSILSDSVGGGMWQGGNGHITLNDNALDSGVVVGISAGTAIITYVMDLGCFTTAVVTVNTLPVVTANVSPLKCYGGKDGSITVMPNGGDSSLKYLWSDSAVTATISGLTPGTYTVFIKDTISQCAVTDSFTIVSPDSIQITADVTNVLCLEPNGAISLSVAGGTPPYKYEWSDKSTASSISGLVAGSYSVTVTDANGCTQKYTTLLQDTACHDIVIFNAISPNGDGINDTWEIQGLQHYPNNTVQVFDTWGDEVFEESNYKNDWGGMGKGGKELPDGTYYYLVKINGQKTPDGQDAFTGYLMIKR